MLVKRNYAQDKEFNAYSTVLRTISHRYVPILKDGKDTSDEEWFLCYVAFFCQ